MTLTVSQLNNQIKAILESTFDRVTVRGEISRITYHSSGHVYFDIKDSTSTLNCVMFRGNVSKLKFRLEQGQDIVLDATISVYIPRGSYQLNCFGATPAGEGALSLAYEQLKKKLEAKGYFDQIHKKSLPRYPKHIAIVTSKTGAALQDMLRVAEKRWKLLKVTLINSLVQGESASSNLADSIMRADSLSADIIIVGRGGGSIEDLWCFNEENVADALFACKTPTISAVGHEIDYVISDFVADVRAATPSVAMEVSLPDSYEILLNINEGIDKFDRILNTLLSQKKASLVHLKELFQHNSPKERLMRKREEIMTLQKRLKEQLEFLILKKESEVRPMKESIKRNKNFHISQKEAQLEALKKNLTILDPRNVLKEGYSQVIKNNSLTSLEDLLVEDVISLIDKSTKIDAKVISKSSL